MDRSTALIEEEPPSTAPPPPKRDDRRLVDDSTELLAGGSIAAALRRAIADVHVRGNLRREQIRFGSTIALLAIAALLGYGGVVADWRVYVPTLGAYAAAAAALLLTLRFPRLAS